MSWENILKNQGILYKEIKKNKSPMHITQLARRFPRMAQSGYLQNYLKILIREGKIKKKGEFYTVK